MFGGTRCVEKLLPSRMKLVAWFYCWSEPEGELKSTQQSFRIKKNFNYFFSRRGPHSYFFCDENCCLQD